MQRLGWGGVGYNVPVCQATVTLSYLVHGLLTIRHIWRTLQPVPLLPNILTIFKLKQIWCTLPLVLLLPNMLTIFTLKQIWCTLQLVLLLPNILNMMNFPVTHRKRTVHLKVETWKKSEATIAGTQTVDRWWQSVDCFIPSALNNKDWSKGGLNQKLILYMHAFVWRYHLPVTTDLKSHLSKLKWVKTNRAGTADFTRLTPIMYLQDEMLSKTQMTPS